MSFVDITRSVADDEFIQNDFQERVLEAYYQEDVDAFDESPDNSFFISWDDIREGYPDFAQDLVNNPERFYYQAEASLRAFNTNTSNAELRLVDHPVTEDIRDLRARHINSLVTVEGIISKITEVKPKFAQVTYQCPDDGVETTRIQDEELLDTVSCKECGKDLDHTHISFQESSLLDYQRIQLQEPPESVSGGDNPQSINVTLVGDLTGEFSPGDRVTASGILKGDFINETQSTVKSILNTYMQGFSVNKEKQDYEEVNITDEDIESIKQFASQSNLLTTLADSIAPSIYGYHTEKQALVLQLFSGVPKHVDDGNTRLRGDIHMLFVGDPGTAKSQLIRYVKQLSPRGVFTSGKGSSAAGITAAAVRDSDFGGSDKWTIQAGALVLADKGIACIDELDKMSPNDRSALHEALEQQTVSINKAGINTTLKSRCSVVAAANPDEGRFDPYKTVSEQIDLEPPLVSRFDLIFIFRDTPDTDEDSKIASHILDTNQSGEQNANDTVRQTTNTEKTDAQLRNNDTTDVTETQDSSSEDTVEEFLDIDLESTTQQEPQPNSSETRNEEHIDSTFFRKYIAYARQNVQPIMTEEAKQEIQEFYVTIREDGADDGRISITARKLESIVRLSEASARIRLSDTVTKQDTTQAIEILKASLRESGTDPETGELDAGVTEQGTSKTQADRKEIIITTINELNDEIDDEYEYASLESILDTLEEQGVDIDKAKEEIGTMTNKGVLIEPSTNYYRVV